MELRYPEGKNACTVHSLGLPEFYVHKNQRTQGTIGQADRRSNTRQSGELEKREEAFKLDRQSVTA